MAVLKTQNDRLEYPSTILELSTGDFDEGDIVLPKIHIQQGLKHHSSIIVFVFLKPLLKIR